MLKGGSGAAACNMVCPYGDAMSLKIRAFLALYPPAAQIIARIDL
jgi:hypothetical protein